LLSITKITIFHKIKLVTHNKTVKKLLFIIFAIIFAFTPAVGVTFCATEQVEEQVGNMDFFYSSRAFEYDYNKNIKQSSIFNLNYQFNKYNRFGSTKDRQKLLQHMLNLGFDNGVALNYIFPNLNKKFEEIEKNINIIPKSAQLIVNTNADKVFNITPEVKGVALDKPSLYKAITNNFLNNKSLKFKIPVVITTPETTKDKLAKFTNLRADFSTDISSSSADRKHNIKNALASLNKCEVAPGQTFSFNKTVGRRTKENGYRQAKIIVNNEFVEGFGGGVCQVSTTLYNAALLAGLDINEANKHSKQISYVKYGFDAMVNYGSSDLRWTNNTNQKLIIITNYTNNKARIRIFGEALDNISYKLKNEIKNVVEPETEIVVDEQGKYKDKVEFEDESFYLQHSARGMEINSYREKYINGVKVGEELLRKDKYKVQNAIKVVGAKKREVSIIDIFNLAS